MRRALTRRLVHVVAGSAIAVAGLAAIWSPRGETCERDHDREREVRITPIRLPTEPGTPTRVPTRDTDVFGRVVDAQGHAVAGVLVVARPVRGAAGDPLGGGVLTDRQGRFRIVGLPPGKYWFVAIHGGYPFGFTPAMPVEDHLEVAITLDDATLQT